MDQAAHSEDPDYSEWDECFDRIIDYVADGITVVDRECRTHLVNVAAANMFGVAREDVLGKPCDDPAWRLATPEGRPFRKEELACSRALRSAQPVRGVEYMITRPDGSQIVVSVAAVPITNAKGRVSAVLNTYTDITAERASEQVLREVGRRYKALADEAEDAIFIIDRQGLIAYVNTAAAMMAGAPAQDLVGRPAGEALGLDRFEEQMKQIGRVIETGERMRVEERFDLRTGSVWLDTSLVPLKDEADEVTAVMGVARDVTERRLGEEALRESEERYRLLFDANPQPMWVYDVDTLAFLAVNAAAVRHYGYSREEFLSMTIADIRPAEDISTLMESVSRMTEGLDRSGVRRHKKKDGTVIDVDIQSHALLFDGRRAELVLANDLTELKETEQELAKNERFLNSIFSSIQDGISVLDRDMNIIRVNRAMEDWYRHAMPLEGKRCYEAYHSQDRICDPCPSSRALRTSQPAYNIVPRRGPGGRIIGWLDLFAFPLIDQDTGETNGVIEYVRDITEQEVAREELKASEERYRRLIDAAPVGIAVQREGRIDFINPAGATILGASGLRDIIGRPFTDFVPPEQRAEMIKGFMEARAQRQSRVEALEQTCLRIDGQAVDVELVSIPMYRNGDEYATQIVFLDVTARKRAEEELRWLASFPKLNPSPIIETDTRGAVTYLNPAAEEQFPELTSAGAEHPLLAGLLELADRADHEDGHSLADDVAIGERTFHREVRHDPERNHIRVHAVDITDRRIADARLRDSEARLRDIIGNTNAIVFVTDLDGRFALVNREFERLFKATEESVLGKRIEDVFAAPEMAQALNARARQVLETAAPLQMEDVVRMASGERTYMSLTFPLRDAAGSIYAACTVSTDITEVKRAEGELQERDRAIRQAYVDVIAAVTGNKLILMTEAELEAALGEPVSPLRELKAFEDLSAARADIKKSFAESFPDVTTVDELIVGVCEALTNSIKHAGAARYQVFRHDETAQVMIADDGPGVDFTTLPKAALEAGFSTKGSLGVGFTIMLELSDRLLLSTQEGGTIVVLETAG